MAGRAWLLRCYPPPCSQRLGRHRWVIERTLAWFGRFRRLTVRYERRLDILTGSHLLAASLICLGFAGRWSC